MCSACSNQAKDLAERARRLSRRLDALDEQLDSLVQDLEELGSEHHGEPVEPRAAGARRGRPHACDARTFLRRSAARGVGSLKIVRRIDGGFSVKVGDSEPFRLPTGLGALLQLLSHREGTSPDQLVPWKSFDALAVALTGRDGPRARHAVSQSISRLRLALETAGINPELVQTSRQQGARFALRAAGREPPRGGSAVSSNRPPPDPRLQGGRARAHSR